MPNKTAVIRNEKHHEQFLIYTDINPNNQLPSPSHEICVANHLVSYLQLEA